MGAPMTGALWLMPPVIVIKGTKVTVASVTVSPDAVVTFT
jgi:hypothetical protein